MLERYANYIELELPKLAEIIKARWAPAAPSGSGPGFGGGDMYGEEDFGGGDGCMAAERNLTAGKDLVLPR